MIRVAIAIIIVAMSYSYAYAECGTRGGPGVRGPDGRCKSWSQVERDRNCGPSGCGSENTNERLSPYMKQLGTTPANKLMQCAHGLRNDCN